MREILFRGKRIDNGEWIEGDIIQFPVHGIIRIVEQGLKCKDAEVDSSTVGQCTGLTDKNGRKIFEGDIVNFEHCGSNYCAKVDYERCSYWIINYNVQFPAFLGDVSEEYLEIIGNIHDNPELLEVTK